MISHRIIVKEIKSNIVQYVAPDAPSITDNATLAKYLESMPFEEGDFLCYGQNGISMLGQVNILIDIERDFKYLTFTTYNRFPKVAHILPIGSVTYPMASLYKRWDSVEALRKLNEGEIKSIVMPHYDLILDRCKEHFGSKALAKLETYRTI